MQGKVLHAIPAAIAFAALTHMPAAAQVVFNNVENDHITITIDGKPFTDFQIGEHSSKPFLAPLRSANGLVVTRRFPQEMVEGESRDHPHHRGLFIGYGDVNGVNFWETEPNSQTSPENPSVKGQLKVKSAPSLRSGKKSGAIEALISWIEPGKGEVLEEDRVMTFYAGKVLRVFDVDLTLRAKVDARFADTKEGFFAIRLADSMAGKNGGSMTNAEGAQTEKNVWGVRSEWVDYDGSVDGRKVGIVIFNNPKNGPKPPRWHARDYGLFAVNPFGQKEFDPKAEGKGGIEIKAGDSLRLRYRVVIHPGDYSKKRIAKLYREYSREIEQ